MKLNNFKNFQILDIKRENETLKNKIEKIRSIVFYNIKDGYKTNSQIVHELMKELSK